MALPQANTADRYFRITPEGVPAMQYHEGLIHEGLLAIHSLGDHEGWTAEDTLFVHPPFSRYARQADARARIRRLVTRGWAEEALFPGGGEMPAFTLSRRGARLVSELGPVRSPRVDQMPHHLLTVQMAVLVLLKTGGRLLRLEGDEEIRSKTRKGKARTTDKLPDGVLLFEAKGIERRSVIEILSSKYTNRIIREKYRDLPAETIFAVPTRRLADRVETLIGRRPFVIEPHPGFSTPPNA